jgi:hypothetical protein
MDSKFLEIICPKLLPDIQPQLRQSNNDLLHNTMLNPNTTPSHNNNTNQELKPLPSHNPNLTRDSTTKLTTTNNPFNNRPLHNRDDSFLQVLSI